jgi:hypothetical protein
MAPFAVDLNSNSLRLPGVTNNQSAIGGLTQGTNLRGATVPGVTDNQSAIGGLTEGTNLRVGREGQANRSEGQANRSQECQSDSNHSILLPLVEYRAS